MRQIVFLFLTFSGICTVSAQSPVETINADTTASAIQKNSKPLIDSLAGKDKATIKLSPNPAVNKVQIEIKGFDPGDIYIRIINNNGNRIREEKRVAFTGDEIIVLMFSIDPGIYNLEVLQNKKKARSRLLIQ